MNSLFNTYSGKTIRNPLPGQNWYQLDSKNGLSFINLGGFSIENSINAAAGTTAGVGGSSIGAMFASYQTGANRPQRISMFEGESISEQIINWMDYINNNPRDEIYYSEMINPNLFSNVGNREFRGFLSARSRQENVFGGVEYTIINPESINPNFPIMEVRPLIEARTLKIVQCPTCGNCSGVQVITVSFYNNKSFLRALKRIFTNL